MNAPLRFVLALTLTATACFAAPKRYVISDYGAVGDGTTVNTKAIQAVIDRCATDGGGVVIVPQGTFVSGALYFKPGVNLTVEKDAVLKSTTSMADFPPIYTRWEGIERYWTSAFLNFVGLHDVTVNGEGTIDGSGDAWAGFGKRARPTFDRKAFEAARATAAKQPVPKPEDVYPMPLPTTATINIAPDPALVPAVNAAGVPLPGLFGNMSPPRAIVFQNCSNVRISGLTLKNQARWGYVFIYCDNVVAEKLTARAEHYIPSSDGMDVDSCKDVLITGCDFDCNDDCISIKSGKDVDGRRVNRPCENIVIEKTRFAYGHGGAAMGSETSGGIRHVEVRDCVAEAGNWAPVRIKTQPSRGGVVEDITYRNLDLRGVKQAFEFNLEWNMRINVAGDSRVPPTVRNIKIIGVHGRTTSVGVIHGIEDSFVDGVKFEDCELTADRGLVIDNARNIDTSGLTLHVKEGEAIVRK
jgi:polygalacturonase